MYDAENVEGEPIGTVTSGCPSPVLGKGMNVSMAYVKKGFHKSGTKLVVKVREKMNPVEVTKLPFVPHQYFK